ncbi:bifunctional polysaccharide deacetylase/glycosyltransferase family 2 protein [Streptomyces sp. NL15-2K]|uniref:bifunctional polysaccharide deacetylase/glycosyltransferase family 2 protein n=1 Tax=Streptomyces sp. NL15-2K TaxID=376149 RepID=UPI000F58899F|nr:MULTISPECIES: bifunctional polysaccharide deacetylase/glycosyltransferase family 2 protein [Actinomycetes]WKX15119.1 bifunctional polysaccharide deacetylase/glycosyltransferase family 2 protein [Kutzneria buriramensis]GCB52203.1 bi-functional transferase/deacetylase [Streptomyces sp. NL15-2K]
MKGRHKQSRDPRGHWLLLILVLPAMFAVLIFEGWTEHEVDAAKTRSPCTSPVPDAVAEGNGPVIGINRNGIQTGSMPARTVALTFDGGPDPVWTPRLLDLLRRHQARATFFLFGSQAARHPELVRRIRAEGHEIGSNTYTGAVLGEASPIRFSTELDLTQTALAGAADLNTTLLRMPRTTSPDTLCGREWKAASQAADRGYVLVAADKGSRKPAQGLVRQFSQTETAFQETKKLLDNRSVDRFTTVSDGLDLIPYTPVSTLERWQGTALLWGTSLGRSFSNTMTWILGIAGGLGVLRLGLLALFARAHVRRLERFRPGAPWMREVTEPVTVLVPAYNEEAGIESTILSLLDSTHPDLQIVVIDDGSTDRTAQIAASTGDPRVEVIRKPNEGKAAALNAGLALARHDIVVMVDADTVFEPDAVHQLVQPLAHPAVGAVSGNTKVGNRRGLLAKWQHLEYCFGFNLDRRMFEVLECMTTVPGAIGAFRRDALVAVGGVSDDTLAEDTDLTMALWRAGWRVLYEESAVAWTEVPTSLRQLWRQRYRWCYGTIQSMWKHRRAVLDTGTAGRFGRRGLTYLALFQVVLPLLAPVIDVYALYGVLFLDPLTSAGIWFAFLGLQMVSAGYALRLDGERRWSLWSMPFQIIAYRQLMYLVVIQSVVALLLGSRLKWQRMKRSGTAAEQIGGPAPYKSLPTR